MNASTRRCKSGGASHDSCRQAAFGRAVRGPSPARLLRTRGSRNTPALLNAHHSLFIAFGFVNCFLNALLFLYVYGW